jgi:hypothetical protein
MADQKPARSTSPGLSGRGRDGGLSGIDMAATAATLVWLLLSAGYFLLSSPGEGQGLRFLLACMVVMLPTALIWVAALTAKSARVMREESARLQTAIDAIRQAYVDQAKQNHQGSDPSAALAKRLDAIAAGQKHLETTLAMLSSTRQAPAPSPAPAAAPVAAPDPEQDNQPTLSLGTPAEALQPPLSNQDFIRALHFPETAEDKAGFDALRRALKDRQAAKLIQAAQDVLTLLSQEGIYMDDLRPDLARPEIWRAFAQGTRGREIAALGGVRDRSSLALAAGRMKEDPIFRDAAHHFLRRFDRAFAAFEPQASDAEITEFAGTRSCRAFMLLGRVAGTFD